MTSFSVGLPCRIFLENVYGFSLLMTIASWLRYFLLLDKSYDVIGIVSDGRQLLAEAPSLKPDVIVLHIGMPLLNCLDAAERLRKSLCNSKLTFLTTPDDPNLV